MNEILKTEYCEHFDNYRKKCVEMSFYKYGPAKRNFGERLVNALNSAQICINKYISTGNTEYLADAANYLMFEFMYPTVEGARFKPTGSTESPGKDGVSINEIYEEVSK